MTHTYKFFQMLREFQKYRDLIKRHNLSKELSTER